jgi:hypothetical protein
VTEHLSPSAAPAVEAAELAKPVPQNKSLPDGARSCGRQWRNYYAAAVQALRIMQRSARGMEDPPERHRVCYHRYWAPRARTSRFEIITPRRQTTPLHVPQGARSTAAHRVIKNRARTAPFIRPLLCCFTRDKPVRRL